MKAPENECVNGRLYHVYRFINHNLHLKQMCHVVASGLDEAREQLPSIAEISHWDLNHVAHEIMNIHGRPDERPEELIEWLPKSVAIALAEACDRNHYNDYPGYDPIKINRE